MTKQQTAKKRRAPRLAPSVFRGLAARTVRPELLEELCTI